MDIKRVFNTVKYMNSRQIIYRFRYEISKRYCRKINSKRCFTINESYKFRNKNYIPQNKDMVSDADKILRNEFTFLNELTYQFKDEIDWKIDPFNYRLWNFNLNYFDFLEVLYDSYEIKKDIKYLKKGVELIFQWIEKNEEYDVNTWDPYVVSKRLFNFINFIADIKDKYNVDKLDEINYSIYTQAEYLNKNIEYYLDANHVMMDGKGLVFSGIYFNDSNFLEKGISILENEYKRQVLADGGHYERSPSYQVDVLSHYVECYMLLVKNGMNDKGDLFIKPIEKMATYLEAIIMPNGEIPLLNDSSLDYPFNADDLLKICSVILNKKMFHSCILSNYVLSLLDSHDLKKYNELIGRDKKHNIKNIAMKESGYYIIKDSINNEKIYILVDCGDGGPDYNLGHTHADSLNIVISLGEKELIMDSGTFTYKIGNDRNHYRSTLAHNTITIDNKNSSDIWSGFRVAKRAKSFIEKYEEDEAYIYIRAYHDGYCKTLKKDKIIHTRELVYVYGKGIFIIDTLSGRINNRHSAVLNYNIAKEVFDKEEQKLTTDRNSLFLNISREYEVEHSKYSKEFSIERECMIVRSKWNFSKENSIVTAIMINDNKLELDMDRNNVKIKQNKIKIIQINR